MPLRAGTRLGPYEIVTLLGQGGMGAVYEARDTRLGRTVAVKVLREPRLGARDRFVREARAIAALQHPHVCTLHDVGTEGEVDYLVMEYLEGRTLRGPVPLERVIEYGVQIASALDAAHRQGVTHRDLKPTNIMVTKSGIKVLDFGLARTPGDDTVTMMGVAVGTPAYMAPEQRAGLPADARTDIYALGCVLLELITGRNDPTRPVEPAALDAIVKGCLADNADERWQSARDVGRMLASIDPAAATSARHRGVPWWAALLAAAAGVAAGALAVGFWRTAPEPPLLQLSIPPPRGATFLMARNFEGGVALSPDGTMVAFVARTAGTVQLWIQRLDSLEARPVPGTERAYFPFWSPDSRQVAFYTPGSLKRTAVAGGPVYTVCATDPRARGGAWMPGDVLLVTGLPGGIHRIAAAGGESRLLAAGWWPQPLPGGRHFVFMSAEGVAAASIDGTVPPRTIVEATTAPPAYSAGHLLFARDRRLMALPFDVERLAAAGDAFVVAQSLLTNYRGEIVSFSATNDGLLVYAAGEPLNLLRWRDRDGHPLGDAGPPGNYHTPRLSPDGKRLAFTRVDEGNADVWVADLDRTVSTRLTFDPHLDRFPVWSPDGRTIAFSSGPPRASGLFRKAADGSGGIERLAAGAADQHVMDWSADGHYLAVTRNTIEEGTDLLILPAGRDQAYEFLRTQVSEAHMQFAPGRPARWLAYSSDDTGRREIYVTEFVPGRPAAPARWQISTDGGTMPRWRADGRELFYWGLDGRIMAAAVNGAGQAFQASPPRPLFQVHTPTMRVNDIEFDVAPDGRRFLLIEPAEQTALQSLSFVSNWRAAAR